MTNTSERSTLGFAKSRHATTATLMLAVLLVLSAVSPSYSAAQQPTNPASGCTPSGTRFDLEPLVNAFFIGSHPFQTQASESVALMLGRGGSGDDLVIGTALDARTFGQQFNQSYSDAYYVGRDNDKCEADFEGLIPFSTGGIAPLVVADPAHDAFFIATAQQFPVVGIGIAKSDAATLLNPSSCPNGTQSNPGACWPIDVLANATPAALLVGNPAIAVDQRKTGTGSGDVYVAASQESPGPLNQITLSACARLNLECSQSIIISGTDTNTEYSTVQVRPDGGITVSYASASNCDYVCSEIQFKFVTCTPAGAPNPPTCNAPVLVKTESNRTGAGVGDSLVAQSLFPRHVHRLESDGKTVTTFLVYDRCGVPLDGLVCSQSRVVYTDSTDNGKTWSALQTVGAAAGQQFLGNLALDASTGTVNFAYYSAQNDSRYKIESQVFLAQIAPGQTSVGTPHQITDALFYGSIDLFDRPSIGVAAGGTGKAGQSHVYIHFTGSTTKGTFNGHAFPIIHNILTRFEY
jgi:hypothetical protein